MSGFATSTTLAGILKNIYADGVIDEIPNNTWLQSKIPFNQRKKEGLGYNQPVFLTQEQGMTYYAPNLTTLPSLNSSIPSQTGNAFVVGTNHVMNMAISYEIMARAVQGPQAFEDSMGLVLDSGTRSIRHRIEISMLYGRSDKQLGTFVSSTTVGATATLTFSTGQWAVGFWTGKEGAQLNFYASGALVVGATGTFTLTSVDIANKKITVTESVGGEAATLNTYVNANANAVSVNYQGAFGVEMYGLQKQITNTGSLFGINAANYSMWAGNTYTGTGALTFGQIQQAASLAAGRGLESKLTCLVDPRTWANICSDQAALTRHNDPGGKAVNGFRSITFASQNGDIEIVAHNCVKNGDFFLIPLESYIRLGALDVSMMMPGMDESSMIFPNPTYPGMMARLYTDQALLGFVPSHNVYGTIGTPV